jgi:hypothetical protein
MAITSTQVQNSASVAHTAAGRYKDTGTVAAFSITLGWKPVWVRVLNEAASSSSFEHYVGMTDGHAIKRAVAGDLTVVTANGITLNDDGFTVGLDTDVNVTSEQLDWVAIG